MTNFMRSTFSLTPTGGSALATYLAMLILSICGASPASAQNPGWYGLLGDTAGDTTFRDAVSGRLATETRLTTICTSSQQQDRNQCQLMMPPDDPVLGGLQGHPRQAGFAPFPLLTPPHKRRSPGQKGRLGASG